MQELEKQKVELTPRQEKFRRRYGMNGYPISHEICNTVIWFTMLHAMSHCGMMIVDNCLQIIDKEDEPYDMFIKTYSKQVDFLENGDIMSSTSAFLDMLKELSFILSFIRSFSVVSCPHSQF